MGGLLRLFADILHTFRDIARNALIQGGLFVPWRPRLWVSSTDTFGEPEKHTGRWIGCRIRFCGWVFLLKGDDNFLGQAAPVQSGMRFQTLLERGGKQEIELDQGFFFHNFIMDNICPQ